MNLRTVLGWLALGLIIWWIIEDPVGAAHVVSNVRSWFMSAVHGTGYFFENL